MAGDIPASGTAPDRFNDEGVRDTVEGESIQVALAELAGMTDFIAEDIRDYQDRVEDKFIARRMGRRADRLEDIAEGLDVLTDRVD